MKRFVLWQRAFSPTSIVGSIEASGFVQAANIARAMYGSFHITEWDVATLEHRTTADLFDAIADVREAHAVAGPDL